MAGSDMQAWCDKKLRARLEKMTRTRQPDLPAPQVLVQAPGVTFGFGDLDQPFHTASVGKNFTAALIARLIDRGLLDFDMPVRAFDVGVDLAKLPAADGVDLADELTVGHLLAHTSGLPDPLDPPRGHQTACAIDALANAPNRAWTPRDVLAETVGLPATGRPGTFTYSDANYALLLCIAESAGGAPFTDLMADLVFEPARMTRTGHPHSTASDDDLAALDIAPMWLGGHDVSRSRCLSVGSVDGGAVTTAADLVRFQQQLHRGHLFTTDVLARMTQPRSRMRPGIHYGAGFATLRFSGFMPVVLRGLPEPVGGLGLTACHAFYYPHQDAHVILNFHTTKAMRASFGVHIDIARHLAKLR